MRWIGDRESENVEDRRGVGGGLPVGIGGIGAIVVVLVGLFLGVDPSTLLALLSGNETQQQTETRRADDGGYRSSRMPEANRADSMRPLGSVVRVRAGSPVQPRDPSIVRKTRRRSRSILLPGNEVSVQRARGVRRSLCDCP